MGFSGKTKRKQTQETDPWKHLLSLLIYRNMMQLFIHFKWGNKHLKYLAVVPLLNLCVNICIILKEREMKSANSVRALIFFTYLFNTEINIQLLDTFPSGCLIDLVNICCKSYLNRFSRNILRYFYKSEFKVLNHFGKELEDSRRTGPWILGGFCFNFANSHQSASRLLWSSQAHTKVCGDLWVHSPWKNERALWSIRNSGLWSGVDHSTNIHQLLDLHKLWFQLLFSSWPPSMARYYNKHFVLASSMHWKISMTSIISHFLDKKIREGGNLLQVPQGGSSRSKPECWTGSWPPHSLLHAFHF